MRKLPEVEPCFRDFPVNRLVVEDNKEVGMTIALNRLEERC